MSPDLEKEIVTLVESARKAGSNAADFIAQQAPDVLDQIIRWQIVDGIVSALEFVAVGALSIWFIKWVYKKTMNTGTGWADAGEVPRGIAWFVCGLAILISILGFCLAVESTVKAIAAPKVVILEKLSELAHGPAQRK